MIWLWVWIIVSALFIPLYVRIAKMAEKKDSAIVKAAQDILRQTKEKP